MSAFQSKKFSNAQSKIQSRGFAKKPAKNKQADGTTLPARPMTEKARQIRIDELKKELKALEEME